MTGDRRDRQPPASYQIRVRGHPGPTTLRAFPALHAKTRGRDTLLQGPAADQAALHGVLARIEELGLELLEVRRLPRTGDAPKSPDAERRRTRPPMRPGDARPWSPALLFAESGTDI